MVGVFWGAFTAREPKTYVDNMAELLTWYAEGKVKPVIEGVYSARRRPGHTQTRAQSWRDRKTGVGSHDFCQPE